MYEYFIGMPVLAKLVLAGLVLPYTLVVATELTIAARPVVRPFSVRSDRRR